MTAVSVASPRRLILRSHLSPGDILMLTSAVRDLHLAYPGKFETDVRTSAAALWENNPLLTPLREGDRGVENIEMHYPLVHQSNQRPYHFIHGYAQYLEDRLGLRIPVTEFKGDVHLSGDEKAWVSQVEELGHRHSFWIVVAGGKYDFTAKWWNPACFQQVVDQFRGRIQFVQCGEAHHWHPPLKNVINLVGKTDLRQFIRLVYHADGVLCPVTFAMHLAAAVATKPGKPAHRACVTVAGGREPSHWEAYPHHQFLSTVGMLSCCEQGGCWKSRCQLAGDGDGKDRTNLCEAPVELGPDLRIPRCMEMIRAEDVIRKIEMYYEGGMLEYNNGHARDSGQQSRKAGGGASAEERPKTRKNVLIRFTHGLGDAVQFGIVLRHLQKHRPGWDIDVATLQGKHSAFFGLCRKSLHDGESAPEIAGYDKQFEIGWHEEDEPSDRVPSTKVTRCLREQFGIEPDPSLYNYNIQIGERARRVAAEFLETVCGAVAKQAGRFPTVLLHYEGNTSQDAKNLSHDAAFGICQAAISEGLVPIILDWDNRSPLPNQHTIFSTPVGDGDIWGEFGSGDAEVLAALIAQSTLMIGVDSGPLHVAGATSTPTIGVWTGHFPAQYYDLADNVQHLVPRSWNKLGLARHPQAADFFAQNYRFELYDDVVSGVIAKFASESPQQDGNLLRCGDFWIRQDNVEQDLVVVRDVFDGDAYRTQILSDDAGPQVVVDIGAHIGCFAKLWHRKNPEAQIICVEACPENIEALHANVGEFARIVQAACTYESGPVELLNAVRPNCESTGGSVVVPRAESESTDLRQAGYQYWHDRRELAKVTLEDLMEQFGFDHIDVLKLDCEGSEYSILGKTPSLDRVRIIIGEYHGTSKWNQFRTGIMQGWDYGHMYDGGESGGLFHYANPRWPPASEGASEGCLARLHDAVMEGDESLLLVSEEHYRRLFDRVRTLNPQRIIEFGVRAGYSGLTFQMAAPQAEVIGVDCAMDPESERHLKQAETVLADGAYQLVRGNSRTVEGLPAADLVFVDGEHTYSGCFADLRRAALLSNRILVDDYTTSAHVRRACDDFVASDDACEAELDGQMLFVNRRNGEPHTVPRQPPLRVAVPAGIGDSVWCLTKLPSMLRSYGADRVQIEFCGGPPHRAQDFLNRFDFVESAAPSNWSCVESDPYTSEGVYNWAVSGTGWHDEFDWLLVANQHLERGQRLESWLPQFEIDWSIADRFTYTGAELRHARELEDRLGRFCVFYLGPEKGNTSAGHNRGPLWSPEDWGRLAARCREMGLAIVVTGAEYDRSYFENHALPMIGDCYDAIGKWHIAQTFAVIQRSQFVVAYQSGVGIFSVYMGIPAAMFWRPYGDSIDPSGFVSFDEQMASAWAPRGALEENRYLPLVYGSCTPESIAEFARSNWLGS